MQMVRETVHTNDELKGLKKDKMEKPRPLLRTKKPNF